MGSSLIYGVHENPVIAAVSHETEFQEALKSECQVIFILKSHLLELKRFVSLAHEYHKKIFIHADLVDGLSQDDYGLEFIVSEAKPDGIITTSQRLIKKIKSHHLIAIQRLFIVDSINLTKGIESVRACEPDAIEILPGCMPKIITQICDDTKKPVIAGGLIRTKQDIMESLNAGAIAISTSKSNLWNM